MPHCWLRQPHRQQASRQQAPAPITSAVHCPPLSLKPLLHDLQEPSPLQAAQFATVQGTCGERMGGRRHGSSMVSWGAGVLAVMPPNRRACSAPGHLRAKRQSAAHASPRRTQPRPFRPAAHQPHLLQALPAARLVVAAGAGGALAVAAARLAAHQGALCTHTEAVKEHSGEPSSARRAGGQETLVAHRRAALAPLAQRVGAGLRLQGAAGAAAGGGG